MAENFLTTSLSSILNPRPRQAPLVPQQQMQQSDPWAEFEDVAPTGTAPSATVAPLRQIQAPQPKQPPAQTPAQARKDELETKVIEQKLAKGDRPDPPSGYRYTAAGELEPIPGGPAAKAAKSQGNALAKVQGVLDRIEAIKKDVGDSWVTPGLGETGMSGAALRAIPGTAAYDLGKALQTIDANSAFTALQEMRESSPTGGALGQITERELELLKSTVANLDPNQSQDAFLGNLETARKFYADMLARLSGAPKPAEPKSSASAPPPPGLAGITPATPGVEGEDVDRSAPLPIGTTPRGQEISTQFRSERITPEQEQAMAQFNALLVQGAPDEQLMGVLEQAFPGGSPSEVTLDLIRQRRDPNSALSRWIAENPGRALPYETQVEVPLSLPERVAAEASASPAGSFITGAASVPLSAIEGGAALAGADEFADELRLRRTLMEEANPLPNLAGQVAGGFALPGGRALRTMIPAGAGYGAVEGFGGTPGGVGQRFANALSGGVAGAALPAAFAGAGRGARALTGRAPPGGNEAVALARAAQEERIPISRPIVDPSSRNRMSYYESIPPTGNIVGEGLEATRAGLERRAGELTGRGTPQEPGMMGQRVQNAVRTDLDRQRAAATRIYDRADELGQEMQVFGGEIVRELDDQIQRLERNPNSNRALIDYLSSVRGDFLDANGNLAPKTIGDIRDVRTNLAADISTRNLTKTPAERLITRALNMGKKDIDRDTLDYGANGAQVRDLYREADVRWRLAKRDEKQIAERLLGPADNPKPGKEAMTGALAWLNSGAEGRTNARRFWEKLNPSEQADFAATLASTYGRRAPDEPFSPALFISNTRAIPPSSRALVFGPEGARSIANLRALSRAYTDTAGKLNNSRSGVVANWGKWLGTLSRGGTAGAVLGTLAGGVPGGLAGGAVLGGIEQLMQRHSAKMLMNPDMSRWLSTSPRMLTPQAIQRHIDKLPSIAARQPEIANDIIGLRDGLVSLLGAGAERGARAEDSAEGPKTGQQ